MGNKLNELEKCVQLQGYDLFVIMERLWDDSHDWSVAMDRHRLIRKNRRGRRGGIVVLYVTEQLECREALPGNTG